MCLGFVHSYFSPILIHGFHDLCLASRATFLRERKGKNLCQARGERSERASEDDNMFFSEASLGKDSKKTIR
jgi:hypothetical protein